MNILKRISSNEILAFFDSEHPIKADPVGFNGNKWARNILEQADSDFYGLWHYVELEASEIFDIALPYHNGEGGGDILIDEKGLTVSQAVQKIKNIFDYGKRNPVCWEKISYWQTREFSPIFLSTAPVNAERQKLLSPSMGSLFHLDGLHRLIGWGMVGRFDPGIYGKKGKLAAYLAGKI